MRIEGKDFLRWLHDLRRKSWEEEGRDKLGADKWAKKVKEEAEKIIKHTIPKLEIAKR